MNYQHSFKLYRYLLFLIFVWISHFKVYANEANIPNNCFSPFAFFAPEFDCDNNNYTLRVAVLDLGGADSLALMLNGDTLASILQIGVVEIGPFDIPSSLTFTLVHNQDTTCNVSGTLTF